MIQDVLRIITAEHMRVRRKMFYFIVPVAALLVVIIQPSRLIDSLSSCILGLRLVTGSSTSRAGRRVATFFIGLNGNTLQAVRYACRFRDCVVLVRWCCLVWRRFSSGAINSQLSFV